MTTKQYLNQITLLDEKISNRIAELEQYGAMICRLQSLEYKERVQTTPNFDKIGSMVAKLDAMERKLDEIITEYTQKRELIVNQIESMSGEMIYEILYMKYIGGMTLTDIAKLKNYSFRHINRLHGTAILEFEKRYGNYYLKSA